MASFRVWLSALLIILFAAATPLRAATADQEVQTTWRLLDYIAVDYREAVRDGKVVATRKFANTCIQMSKSSIPKGARAQAFTITHLLDPVPTEIHVFNALASRTMVIVGTTSNMMLYSIKPAGDRAKITVLDQIK